MLKLLPHERTGTARPARSGRFASPDSVRPTARTHAAPARGDEWAQRTTAPGPVLVESRTITGDRRALAALAQALRKRSEDHVGHLQEVHFQAQGGRIRFLTLWRSPTDLRDFVTDSHPDVLAFRTATDTFPGVERTLWWSTPGTPVSLAEADERAGHLHEHGPGPTAFTLRSPVPPPA